jgi:hypothetical protein
MQRFEEFPSKMKEELCVQLYDENILSEKSNNCKNAPYKTSNDL